MKKHYSIYRLFVFLVSTVLVSTFVVPVTAADKTKTVVKVAYFNCGDYYQKQRGGKINSYDNAYLDKVSAYTGLTFEYVNCRSWANAMKMLEQHQVDLLGTMQKSTARQNRYAMCENSYGTTVAELAALPGSSLEYEEYDALKELDIGVVKGYVRMTELKKLIKDRKLTPKIHYYKTQEALISALESKKITLAAANSHTIPASCKVIEQFCYATFYFATWKGNEALVNQIDHAILNINLYEPEFQHKLQDQYFFNLKNAPFSKKELDCVAQEKTYTIYFDESTQPLAWYDTKKKTMQGGLIDLCKKLEEVTGLHFVYRPLSAYNGTAKDTDVLYGTKLMQTPSDAAAGETESILDSDFAFYYEVSSSFDTMNNGSSYRVAVPKNSSATRDFLAKNYPHCTIVTCENPENGLVMLQNGECDLAFLSGYTAENFLIRKNIHDISSIPSRTTSIGVNLIFHGADRAVLAKIVNKGIHLLDSQTKNDILMGYALDAEPEPTVSVLLDRYSPFVLLFAIVVLLLFLFSLKQRRDYDSLQNSMNETVQNVPAGLAIYEYDEQIKPVYISDRACAMFGFTREECQKYLERGKLGYFTPDINRFDKKDLDAEQMTTELPPFPAQRKDQSWFWLRLSMTVLHRGRKPRIYAVLTDVTQEYQNNERLDTLINSIPGGVLKCAVDQDYQLTYVSNTLYQLLGYTAEAFRAKFHGRFRELICVQDRESSLAQINEQLKSGCAYADAEYRIVCGDGQLRWFYAVGHLVQELDESQSMYVLLIDNDERKRNREQIAEETKKIEALISNAPGGVIAFTAREGKIICDYVSESAAKLHDDTPEAIMETLSHSVFSYVHPEDAETLRKALEQAIRNKERMAIQYRLMQQDQKSYVWVDMKGVPFTTADNNLACYCSYTDVTEMQENTQRMRQRYENELKYLNEVHSENLIDKARVNLTGNQLVAYKSYYNAELCQEGISYTELLEILGKRTVDDAQIAELMEKFSLSNLRSMYQRGEVQVSTRYLRRLYDYQPPIWAELTIKIYENPETHELNGFIYTVDVNDQVVFSNIMDRLYDTSNSVIALIDTQSNLIRIIRDTTAGSFTNGETLFDYPERARRVAEQYVVPSEREEARAALSMEVIRRSLEEEDEYSCSFSVTIDGKFQRTKWNFANLNDRKTVIIYTRTDITKLYRQTNEQQRRMNQALRKAEKANAAKTEFLSAMSHDIRTPMNAIINVAQMVREDASGLGDGNIFEDLDRLDAASKFLKSLINDVLDMSKIESGKMTLRPEVYELEQLLSYLTAVFEPLAQEKGVHLSWKTGSTQEILYVDKTRLNQVMTNLLSNAIKYTPEGGSVSFRICDKKVKNGVLYCGFEVKDTGCGMSEEFQKKMFQPFEREQRTVQATEGTGLGLAIVKNIVDLMDGSLVVKSEPNQGTVVTVHLKLLLATEGQRTHQSKHQVRNQNGAFAGRQILIAEDNALNVMVLKRLLEREEIMVQVAQDGAEAVEKFASSDQNTYDMIFMDIRMPVLDGFEATKQIRALDRADARTVPIVAVTADIFSDDGEMLRKVGMTDCLFKPIDPQKLYEMIRIQLKGSTPPTGEVSTQVDPE